jgi:hypothetical protein
MAFFSCDLQIGLGGFFFPLVHFMNIFEPALAFLHRGVGGKERLVLSLSFCTFVSSCIYSVYILELECTRLVHLKLHILYIWIYSLILHIMVNAKSTHRFTN